MHPLHRRSPLTRLVCTATICAVVAVLVAASPAAAHDGEAVVTVESQTGQEMSVDYVVRAVWDNDGHAAADATATVVAENAAGDQVGPVSMEPADDDGRYTATVEFPAAGDWNVRFTVVTPPGTLEITQTVPAASEPTTTAAPTTTPTPTTAPASTSEEDPATETASASTGDRERPTSNGGAAIFFFIVAAIILGACLLAYRSRGQRRPAPPVRKANPDDTSGTAASEGTADGADSEDEPDADVSADAVDPAPATGAGGDSTE